MPDRPSRRLRYVGLRASQARIIGNDWAQLDGHNSLTEGRWCEMVRANFRALLVAAWRKPPPVPAPNLFPPSLVAIRPPPSRSLRYGAVGGALRERLQSRRTRSKITPPYWPEMPLTAGLGRVAAQWRAFLAATFSHKGRVEGRNLEHRLSAVGVCFGECDRKAFVGIRPSALSRIDTTSSRRLTAKAHHGLFVDGRPRPGGPGRQRSGSGSVSQALPSHH
jgi:hypothetical protein